MLKYSENYFLLVKQACSQKVALKTGMNIRADRNFQNRRVRCSEIVGPADRSREIIRDPGDYTYQLKPF